MSVHTYLWPGCGDEPNFAKQHRSRERCAGETRHQSDKNRTRKKRMIGAKSDLKILNLKAGLKEEKRRKTVRIEFCVSLLLLGLFFFVVSRESGRPASGDRERASEWSG